MNNNTNLEQRDTFSGKWGFILSCVGSSVGMGNIWMFPTRVSTLGGGNFIIAYFICVVILGYSGVIGEMALGRATKSSTIGAFGQATDYRGMGKKPGKLLGIIPTVGSLLLAIGYTVVVGWVFAYFLKAINGSMMTIGSIDSYGGVFEGLASPFGNNIWVVIALVLSFVVMNAGISGGIEKLNKVMMPLFYLLFIILAIYVARLPGAENGYRYIFSFSLEGFLRPEVWIFALGQSFFSLSLGGSGTVTYGSYLDDREDILSSALIIAIFDTSAALLAMLVIIPAMATTGTQLDIGGPGLMFIHLPHLFADMPGGRIVSVIFFAAVLFGALTSIVNLYETSVSALQDELKFSRTKSVVTIGAIGLIISLLIQGIVGPWMDVVSIYINPLGAIIAAFMIYWIFGTDFARAEIQKSRDKKIGSWFEPMTKYVFCGITVLVYVLGLVMGGIG